MSTFKKQFLIIGGAFIAFSFIFSTARASFPDIRLFFLLKQLNFIYFVVGIIVLCFKREIIMITDLQNALPKSCNYLMAFGIYFYIAILVGILGFAYGFYSESLSYSKALSESTFEAVNTVVKYLLFAVNIVALVWPLIWATRQSFFPKKQ